MLFARIAVLVGVGRAATCGGRRSTSSIAIALSADVPRTNAAFAAGVLAARTAGRGGACDPAARRRRRRTGSDRMLSRPRARPRACRLRSEPGVVDPTGVAVVDHLGHRAGEQGARRAARRGRTGGGTGRWRRRVSGVRRRRDRPAGNSRAGGRSPERASHCRRCRRRCRRGCPPGQIRCPGLQERYTFTACGRRVRSGGDVRASTLSAACTNAARTGAVGLDRGRAERAAAGPAPVHVTEVPVEARPAPVERRRQVAEGGEGSIVRAPPGGRSG